MQADCRIFRAAKNNEEKMRCNRDGVNMLSGCAIIELVVVLAFGGRAKRIPAFDRNLTRASSVGRKRGPFNPHRSKYRSILIGFVTVLFS